jgi:hypothetical protein
MCVCTDAQFPCPSVRLFVRPYACIGAPHTGRVSAKFDIRDFYENLSRISEPLLKWDKNDG